jgi:hypothetical protein
MLLGLEVSIGKNVIIYEILFFPLCLSKRLYSNGVYWVVCGDFRMSSGDFGCVRCGEREV